MTDPINYSSREWADHVAFELYEVRLHLQEAGHQLRRLAEDMDADGHDMDRGPHAPPVEDIRALVRIATSLTAQQQSSWTGYAAHRRSDERSTYDVLRQARDGGR